MFAGTGSLWFAYPTYPSLMFNAKHLFATVLAEFLFFRHKDLSFGDSTLLSVQKATTRYPRASASQSACICDSLNLVGNAHSGHNLIFPNRNFRRSGRHITASAERGFGFRVIKRVSAAFVVGNDAHEPYAERLRQLRRFPARIFNRLVPRLAHELIAL